MKSSSAGKGASEARGNVAHEVTADTTWWPNGSSGREIRCVTCQPNRLLWQSPPDVAFAWSEEFFASVAKAHRVMMNAAWESSADSVDNSPVTPVDELTPVDGPAVLPEPERPSTLKGGSLLNAKQERRPSLETGLAYEPDQDGNDAR